MMRPILFAALLLAATPSLSFAAAERSGGGGEPAAAAPGRQMPLSRVLKTLAHRYKGKQLNTTMGEAGGRPAYLVQWQLGNGRITVFTVDAQTGQVLAKQGG
ncbi:MAG TPA: hypothetical protein VFE18_08975 [Phenylobacterium sp.]|jgi:uncharacterized membrane protein YkoI|nr:hypothetical protein [Phenylobacterium sp.]